MISSRIVHSLSHTIVCHRVWKSLIVFSEHEVLSAIHAHVLNFDRFQCQSSLTVQNSLHPGPHQLARPQGLHEPTVSTPCTMLLLRCRHHSNIFERNSNTVSTCLLRRAPALSRSHHTIPWLKPLRIQCNDGTTECVEFMKVSLSGFVNERCKNREQFLSE